jgi:hypothetical protein
MALNMQTDGECHTTTFTTPLTSNPSPLTPNPSPLTFEVRLLPSHPVEGNKLSFRLTLDGTDSKEIEYQTYGRSEEWKQNILRGYAVRKITLPANGKKKHKLTFRPLTPGVVLQEIRLIEN